ncbi:hypothetical protein GGS20DRAFT_287193 [Poronia punctata]|nr:hypothetical protein GGS20DRAFT_287193 [Poronia punctata]
MSQPPNPKEKERQKSKEENGPNEDITGEDDEELVSRPRFSPEEEASLLSESNEKKSEANELFSSSKHESAIEKYEEAAHICPHYLDYELAVIRSNIAACHLKLEQYAEAIKSATESLEGLSRCEKTEGGINTKTETEKASEPAPGDEDEAEEEIVSEGAQKSAPAIVDSRATAAQKRRDDIMRIRAKALMRRARARSELGGWSNLSGAEEDYKTLATMTNLSAADEKIVRSQLRALPPRVKEAQEKEMAEMWGKLKNLGNGILRPFGLSTENFKMVKDEKTGGYSMSFNQNQ